MKTYPSIQTNLYKHHDARFIAFDKLDGSNIRVEWSKKRGFYKFGSRNKLLDSSHPLLGYSVLLIEEKEKELASIFNANKWERVIAFFEFYGQNSFAGSHEEEQHKVTLIDVSVYKQGFVPAPDFIKLFGDVGIPKVLYKGDLEVSFVDSVKDGSLKGMTFEGVVCKYGVKHDYKMFKIKSKQWLEKLKIMCNGNEALYRKLA